MPPFTWFINDSSRVVLFAAFLGAVITVISSGTAWLSAAQTAFDAHVVEEKKKALLVARDTLLHTMLLRISELALRPLSSEADVSVYENDATKFEEDFRDQMKGHLSPLEVEVMFSRSTGPKMLFLNSFNEEGSNIKSHTMAWQSRLMEIARKYALSPTVG